ncbi:putative F-box/FBD/LRR-repeat protein [Sesbania bispinosa]|nr:putative F-box/FBD/LRR-repeat protein [Sesbania bispinosa]
MEHDRNWSPDCKIVLSSPRIKTFDFTESHVVPFSVPGLPSIERVYLDVAHIHYLFGNNQVAKEGFITRLIHMFRAVGNIAMKVTLSFETIRILSLCPDDLLQHPSPFTGMERLRVKVPHEHYNRITIPVNVLLFLLNGTPAIDFEILRVLSLY